MKLNDQKYELQLDKLLAEEPEATELIELVTQQLKKAIQDTEKTRKRLNKTLQSLERA